MKRTIFLFSFCVLFCTKALSQSEAEPNDNSQQANFLYYNDSIKGLINNPDGVDWYKIILPQGGKLNLQFRSDGGPAATLKLMDSAQLNATLGTASCYYLIQTRDSIIAPVLQGIYFIAVNLSGGSGTYTIESKLQILKWPEDNELNNSFDRAGDLPANGTITGLIGHYSPAVKAADPADWFKIKVPQGGKLNLQFYSDGTQAATLSLMDSAQLNARLGNASCYYLIQTRDSIIAPLLQGTYFIAVNLTQGSGAYRIDSRLQILKWPEDNELNNTFDKAGDLPANGTATGLIGHYSPKIQTYDPADWFKIKVPQGGKLNIQFNSDGGYAATLKLMDSVQLNVSLGDASFYYLTQIRDSIIAPVRQGTYYIAVNLTQGSGAYRIESKLIPVPTVDFIFTQNDSRFVFENKTIGGQSYKWNFDDGSQNMTVVNPLHEYVLPGVYDVCLEAQNKGGNDTLCRQVSVLGLGRIFPASAGNTGDATITVFGGGLDTFFTFSLVQNGIKVVQSTSVALGLKGTLVTTLDLRKISLGSYDVMITKSGGPSYNIPRGFNVIQGIAADPWIRINGRNRMLFNTWTTYTVEYGNNGNVDATMVPVWLVFSRPPSFDLKFVNARFENLDLTDPNPEEEVYIDMDSLLGAPYKSRIYPLILPVIPPGTVRTFQIRIKSGEDIKMTAWAEKPWFQSPINEKKLECYADISSRISDSLFFVQNKCVIVNFGKLIGAILANQLRNGKDSDRDSLFVGYVIVSYLTTLNRVLDYCEVKDKKMRNEYRQRMIENVFDIINQSHGNPFVRNNSGSAPGDGCSDEFQPLNPQSTTVTTVSSLDPNEKSGFTGYGADHYVSEQKSLPYTIHFENKASATAPAHTVLVTDTLDKNKFDLSTFSFGDIIIGDQIITPESGLRSYANDQKMNTINVTTRINATLDQSTGKVEWLFRSLDPGSLDDIEDPDLGFLPPNMKIPEGQGSVSFTVRLKQAPRHDEKIDNKAAIFFDANEPILTNIHLVTFDVLAPESAVHLVPAPTLAGPITIRWSGQDNGSGIKAYNIYFSTNGGRDSLWIANTSTTSALFKGITGNTYRFYSIATDHAGNIEAAPSRPDAEIRIVVAVNDLRADSGLIVFPNPANDFITFSTFSSDYKTAGQLSIAGIDGRIILNQFIRGNTYLKISSRQWHAGIYLWKYTTSTAKPRTGKILVVH